MLQQQEVRRQFNPGDCELAETQSSNAEKLPSHQGYSVEGSENRYKRRSIREGARDGRTRTTAV